jgi:alpha-glucosidase
VSTLPTDPVARPDQVVSLGRVRVTVLTDRLLRIEYASDGEFEDRPTSAVVNRRFPPTRFRAHNDGHALTVDTGTVQLRCDDVTRPFTARRLHARIGTGPSATQWRYGQAERGNLGGTVRTLDGWKGTKTARAVGFDPEAGILREWDEQSLGPGLLSRQGWVVLDDSGTVVFDADADASRSRSARSWPVPRPPGERRDLYLFAYGTDHRAALEAGTRLLGAQPLPPRFAFGYWYSRYYPYTDRELVQIAEQFDHYDVPADVLVVDMDWHQLGWTGYSWDRDLFPDPTETLDRIHDLGLRVALNLHPADGVGRHEDAFGAMCEALGLDPDDTDGIPFDITDPRFVAAYFRLLHHPEEDRGVDVWWMDWQQGTESAIAGLDPLAWLNELHWDDQARRRPNRRPLIFSRWGGLGAGRYPIGFSGDTYADWESLAYQPEFTATAANVLYGYWSHDIGGHFGSTPDPELYARWVQFGAHSPVLRTHGTLDAYQERRLWEFPNPYRTVMIDAVRRRYELVPYLYGECRSGVDTGRSLVRPMYHEHPDVEAAYDAPGQYHFGEHMVVAPATRPLDDDGMVGVAVWLPQGEWFDVAHGARLPIDRDGGEWLERRYLLDEVPVFVPAGTVVPTQRGVRRLDATSYPNLVVTAYPGRDGAYELYEDDGTSTGYERDRSVWLPLSHLVRARSRRLTVGPARGTYRGWTRTRPVEVRFVGEAPPTAVRIGDRAVPWAASRRDGHWWYDAAEATVAVSLPRVDLRGETTVSLDRPSARVRDASDALLDGFPGLARRLAVVSEATRALVGDDSRPVVRLSRTPDRIARDPSTLLAELQGVRAGLADLDALLERAAAHWRELHTLNPTDPPRAAQTLDATRRLLATTRQQA